MPNEKLRRHIAFEAARLIVQHQETNYHQAKLRAARKAGYRWVQPANLPTDQELRDQIQGLARRVGTPSPDDQEGDLGPAGGESAESDISHAPGTSAIPIVPRDGETPSREADDRPGYGFGSDRFQRYRALLAPLEHVHQRPEFHPEGDALYHSLQVFELARNELPYDEEFLLGALLHDVGKAIDAHDPMPAALEALSGLITPRTEWFLLHLAEAHALLDGEIGQRARRRLDESEDRDELMLLARFDRAGRVRGAQVSDLDDALAYVKDLARTCDA